MITVHWISIPTLILQTGVLCLVLWLLSAWKNISPRLMYILWYLIILRHVFPFTLHIQNDRLPNIPFTFAPIFTDMTVQPAISSSFSIATLFQYFWIIGFMILFSLMILNEYLFRKQLKTTPAPDQLLLKLPSFSRRTKIQISSYTDSPLSYGIINPAIILPRSALDLPVSEIQSIIAHEYEHIRRHDVFHTMVQHVLCVLWFFNPFIWIAKRYCEYYREILCDIHSLNRTDITPPDYSGLLLRIIGNSRSMRVLNGMALTRIDGNMYNLKKRIVYLNTTYKKGVTMMFKMKHKILLTLFVIALVLTACNFGTDEKSDAENNVVRIEHVPDEDVQFIPYDTPPSPIGGTDAILKNIIYPEKAKLAELEGTVIIQAFVSEKGEVTKCKIMKSIPNSGLDEAAIDAVTKTKFTPAKQNNKDIGVWIALPVVFRLNY